MSRKKGGAPAESSGCAAILSMLEETVARAGIELRYENLADNEVDIGSGLCYVKRQPTLIIDKNLTDRKKSDILARELKTRDLEAIYVPPVIRDILEGDG